MMSPVKYEERLRHLSTIARKVYDAVPASEPWSLSYIHSEIQRVGGTTKDARIVHGCINSLKDAGLVEEPKRGTFVRVQVRPEKPKPAEKPQPKKEEAMPAVEKKAESALPRTPLAILSELAARVRQLGDDIETAALEIDEHVAQKSAGAEKLAQLQQLLKSLG